MPNLIMGLKYQPTHQQVKTEEQVLEVFADLRKQYFGFIQQDFKIFASTGERISGFDGFEPFLRLAVQENQSVVLTGSGNIGGLEVIDARLVYTLSQVGDLTRYWDQGRDGSCNSCHNHYYDNSTDDGEDACRVMNPMKWNDCQKYDSYIKNSEGKTARKLDELIVEASR